LQPSAKTQAETGESTDPAGVDGEHVAAVAGLGERALRAQTGTGAGAAGVVAGDREHPVAVAGGDQDLVGGRVVGQRHDDAVCLALGREDRRGQQQRREDRAAHRVCLRRGVDAARGTPRVRPVTGPVTVAFRAFVRSIRCAVRNDAAMDPLRTVAGFWNWLPAFRAVAETCHLPMNLFLQFNNIKMSFFLLRELFCLFFHCFGAAFYECDTCPKFFLQIL